METPYSQAAQDPTQQQGLLQILQQIQAIQNRPLIPDNPLSQLGAALQGASAGFAGQPNPAVAQAMAQRQQQLSSLSQTAGVLGQIATMQQHQATLAETKRQHEATLLETQRARTVQEAAERRRNEIENRKAGTETQKSALEMLKFKADIGNKMIRDGQAFGLPATALEGQKILSETLGSLGYTVAPEVATELATKPPSKEDFLTVVRLRATGVPIDHIAKAVPTIRKETLQVLATAIDKKDDFVLKTFNLPSVTEIEADKVRLATERQKLLNEQAKVDEGGQIKESNVQAMRREFNALSKSFIDVKESFQKIQESSRNPSAFGDISLIFGYMKMLDPTSVVRETEFATAANAGSIPTRVQNLWNRALSGERLTDAQRADIVVQSRAILKQALGGQERLEGEYRRIADERKVPSTSVVVDHIGPFRGLTKTPMAANAPPATATLNDAKQEMARLKTRYPSLTTDHVKDLMRGAGWN